jgi:hypothetical protein
MVEPDTPEPTTSTSVSSGSYTQQQRDDMETVMLPHTSVHSTSKRTPIFHSGRSFDFCCYQAISPLQ